MIHIRFDWMYNCYRFFWKDQMISVAGYWHINKPNELDGILPVYGLKRIGATLHCA